MIGLPPIRKSGLWGALAAGYVVFCAMYLGAALIAPGPARLLVPGAVDRAVPFVDGSIWIYLSQYALLPVALAGARDDFERTQAFYSMLSATLIAALVFVVSPTYIERQTQLPGGITGLAWSALYFADVPGNCFPSLHVALALIAGTALWRRGSRLAGSAWAALIAAATLTTKQHVFIDVCGGAVLAAAAWLLTSRLVNHERAQRTAHTARI